MTALTAFELYAKCQRARAYVQSEGPTGVPIVVDALDAVLREIGGGLRRILTPAKELDKTKDAK